jgi:hypothetical protein
VRGRGGAWLRLQPQWHALAPLWLRGQYNGGGGAVTGGAQGRWGGHGGARARALTNALRTRAALAEVSYLHAYLHIVRFALSEGPVPAGGQ